MTAAIGVVGRIVVDVGVAVEGDGVEGFGMRLSG